MITAAGEVILYRTDDGGALLQLRAVGGTVWLTRGQMADLYGTTPQNIGQIISRVLADGEVSESTRNSEFLVRREGDREVRRRVDVYNLDMVLAVGYRRRALEAQQASADEISDLDELLAAERRLTSREGHDGHEPE